MGRMMCPLVVVAMAIGPMDGRAQTMATGDRAPGDPLVVEMRLLRQAVDRLTVLAVKSQLAVSRLVAQQQQLARAQDAVDRAEEAIAAADRNQERTRATLARVGRQLDNVVEEPRSEIRREVESLRAGLDDHDRRVESLRMRLSRAEQSLRSEQESYRRLEAALIALEVELQRPKP
jgi:chromosome segregation ATPase